MIVEDLKFNLLSIRCLEDNGFTVVFEDGRTFIKREETIIAASDVSDGLYILSLQTTNESRNCGANVSRLDLPGNNTLWHRRLGHTALIQPDSKCETCIEATITGLPHKRTKTKVKTPFEKIYVDVCGLITPRGLNNERYFLTVVDDYSHFIAVFPIYKKSDVYEILKEQKQKLENKYNAKIKIVRCDKGREFDNQQLKSIFSECEFEITPAFTHQLNGVAERANRTICDMSRAMILDGRLPKFIWSEVVTYSAYI